MGIADNLAVNAAGARIEGPADSRQIGKVHKAAPDSEFCEGFGYEQPGVAEEVIGSDDGFPACGKTHERARDCSHS